MVITHNSWRPHGQFEDKAYRCFPRKEYADQFIRGEIRFGVIDYYKNIEDDIRRDKTEGESHFIVGVRSGHSFFASNSIYILCFHRTLQSAKESGFGPFIVEINNVRQLAEDITEQLEKSPSKFFAGIEGVIVVYTKGEVIERKPSSIEIGRLAYAQKPRDPFSVENEFRFVIISKEYLGDFLTIKLGKHLDYAKLIS